MRTITAKPSLPDEHAWPPYISRAYYAYSYSREYADITVHRFRYEGHRDHWLRLRDPLDHIRLCGRASDRLVRRAKRGITINFVNHPKWYTP